MAQGLEEERAGSTTKGGPDVILASIDQNEHDLKEINRKVCAFEFVQVTEQRAKYIDTDIRKPRTCIRRAPST
jgi:hypothetical protein